MNQMKRSPAHRRRRRALEAAVFTALLAAAAFSGSMVKRSVSAPPAAAIDQVPTPRDGSNVHGAAPTAVDPEAPHEFIAASAETNISSSADPSPRVVADDEFAGLPTAWRDRLAALRDSGAITGEVRVERLEPRSGGSTRYFDGRPVRPVRRFWMTVTAYSPDERSCGIWADGITASNKSVWTNAMQLVAADTRLFPFGTLVSLDEYADGQIVPVLDRGGAIKGMRLDVLYATHAEALRFGVQRVPVTIWEYAD